MGTLPDKLRWPWICALLIFPVAAVMHHAVFFPRMCMLNLYRADYHEAAALWLSTDPSPYAAVAIASLTYLAGRRWPALKTLVPPLVIATIPLSVWIWDIPFAGRPIHHHLHDGRWQLPLIGPARSLYFYVLAIALYVPLAMRSHKRAR